MRGENMATVIFSIGFFIALTWFFGKVEKALDE